MAVGRVDVVAQPDAGLGPARASRLAEPAGGRAAAARRGAVAVLQPEPPGAWQQRAALEQRLGEPVVMVPGQRR